MLNKRKNITGKVTALSSMPNSARLTGGSWHADIKPDNILYMEDRITLGSPLDEGEPSRVEENENKFKLADPGFAKFVKKPPDMSRDNIPRQQLQGGTETYGWYCSTRYLL